jgi:hypothetical protein
VRLLLDLFFFFFTFSLSFPQVTLSSPSLPQKSPYCSKQSDNMLAMTTSFVSIAMLVIPSVVSAMPIAQGRPGFPGGPGGKPGFALQVPSCPLTRAKLELPAGAAAANVTLPAGEQPVFVALGVGVQASLRSYSTEMYMLT